MAQIAIHGTRGTVSASISTFEAGEFHNGFATLNISTSEQDTVIFFFNNLEQIGDLVNNISAKLDMLTETAEILR